VKSRNAKGENGLDRPKPTRVVRPEPSRDIERVLNRQPWDLLTPHLLRAGADIVEVLPRIRRYAELLLEWNRGFSNLISTSDENRLVQRHILESLEPAHWIKSSGARRWLDFGSGGGLPALPLALAGIGDSWTLVESRRNKTLFIRKAIQEFGLTNVGVELARLESLPAEAERLGKFDGFTSRATLRLGPTLVLAADWVPPGGLAYLWKGSRREQEMVEDSRWKAFWDRDDVFTIGNGQTVVARFIRKTS
jgi:16S rRNA (guanine527-N7)-methyltransferase